MYILYYAVEEKDVTAMEWKDIDISGFESFQKVTIEYKGFNSLYIDLFRLVCETNFDERLIKIDKSIKSLFEDENPNHTIKLFQVEKVNNPKLEESLEVFSVKSPSRTHFNISHYEFENENGVRFNATSNLHEDFEIKLENVFNIIDEEYKL